MITATNEDNMKMMARYPDIHFPLAIVDPEYGIKESSKNHKSRNTPVKQRNGTLMTIPNASMYSAKQWDNKPADASYFNELERVSQNQIIFGGNYFDSLMSVNKPPRRDEFQYFIDKNPKGVIIWDKMNGNSDFNDCEIIYTSFDFDSYILYCMWAGMMQGVYCGTDENRASLQQGNKKLNEKRIHPTQKPVILYKWLLMNYAEEGQLILDTHRGSASLDIACHDLGFDLITCEKEKDYFDDGNARLKQHKRQLKLAL